MKRLRRRVENSEYIGTSESSASDSKTLTFDRRTFFECSNRMKRIVPTLSRRQTNSKSAPGSHDLLSQVNPKRLTSSKDEDDDLKLVPKRDNDTAVSSSTDMEVTESDEERMIDGVPLPVPHQTDPGKLLMLTKYHSSKIVSSEFKMGTCVTLPRNMEKSTSIVDARGVGSGSTATLPPTAGPVQRQSSGRRLWMKPVTNFISFMSSIGDNILITSYPTP